MFSKSFILPLLSLTLIASTSSEEIVIRSPPITYFGSWGPFENCSEGSLVTAFQLKMEPRHSIVDDSGLNAVRFFCGLPPPPPSLSPGGDDKPLPSGEDAIQVVNEQEQQGPAPPIWENITSKVGIFGRWGRIFNCSTYAVGFDLEVLAPRGSYKDDVAATNMKLLCADGTELEGYFNNGQGHSFINASYTGAQRCPEGYGICGLQTQVENYQAFGDDTALNNVVAKCCSLADVLPLPDISGSTSNPYANPYKFLI